MRHQKGNFLPILVVIIVLVVISYFLYSYKNNQASQPVSQTPSRVELSTPQPARNVIIPADQTADWTKYNLKDFSFKTPSNTDIKNDLSVQLLGGKKDIYGFSVMPNNLKDYAGNPNWYAGYLFALKNIPQNSTKEYLATIYSYNYSTLKEYKNGVIDGYAFEVTQNGYPYLTVIELKNHILYIFQISGQYGTTLTPYSRDMLDKIISTVNLTGDTTPDPKVTDLISYTLPSGWTQKVTDADISGYAGTIEIASPDQAQVCCGPMMSNAIGIWIKTTRDAKLRTLNQYYKTIYDGIHAPNPGGATDHDLTKTTINGYQTISYFYDFEGHEHTYNVWAGDYLWEIRISSASKEQEDLHSAQINSILSSIKFSN